MYYSNILKKNVIILATASLNLHPVMLVSWHISWMFEKLTSQKDKQIEYLQFGLTEFHAKVL